MSPADQKAAVRSFLHALRDALSTSLDHLAAEIGVSLPTVYRWSAGQVRPDPARFQALRRFAAAKGVHRLWREHFPDDAPAVGELRDAVNGQEFALLRSADGTYGVIRRSGIRTAHNPDAPSHFCEFTVVDQGLQRQAAVRRLASRLRSNGKAS